MPLSALPEPPAPRPRLAGRLQRWAGHRAPHLMTAAILGEGVCFAARHRWPTAALAAIALSVLLSLWSMTAMAAHAGRLCAACIAEMPVDAPARAERRHRGLWLYHVTHEPPLLTLRLALILACGLSGACGLGTGWSLGIWAACFVLWTGALSAFVAHRKVAPWCPYCGWDDGGGWVDTGDPDPAIPRRPGA